MIPSNWPASLPQLPTVQDHVGYDRFLGALPPRLDSSGRILYNAPPFQMAAQTIPRSQWREFDNTIQQVPILDQDGRGSCVGHASASSIMKSRAKLGMTFDLLSPCFIYALGNGGRDAGMVISDAADIILQYGCCLESEFPEGHIYKSQIPQSAYQTASSRFKVLELYHCANFDEIGTAVQLGWDVVYGITVGTGFNNLNSDGVPGGGFPRGGHALCDAEAMKKASNGEWLIKTRNSWTTQWGLNGFCYLNEGFLSGNVDAYAIRVVMLDPQDPNHAQPIVV